MVRFKFIKCIDNLQNDKTIDLIGEIDTTLLNSNRIESVYYSFPLMERMVVEIYKLVPESDIEYHDQGKIRTIDSILDCNDNQIISQQIVDLIKRLFGEEGPRNKIFHVKEKNIQEEVSFNQINFIIMCLLKTLKDLIEKYEGYSFKEIEKI